MFVAYIWYLCAHIFIWPYDLVGVSCISLHTSNAHNTHTKFNQPTIIRSWVTSDSVWWLWSTYHHVKRSLRMCCVTWPITEGRNGPNFFEIPDPNFDINFIDLFWPCCCCWLSGGDRFLCHHELRPSVGPVLNPYPHNSVCVCVCVSAQGRGVRICICICVCCEQSLSSLF